MFSYRFEKKKINKPRWWYPYRPRHHPQMFTYPIRAYNRRIGGPYLKIPCGERENLSCPTRNRIFYAERLKFSRKVLHHRCFFKRIKFLWRLVRFYRIFIAIWILNNNNYVHCNWRVRVLMSKYFHHSRGPFFRSPRGLNSDGGRRRRRRIYDFDSLKL